MTIKDLRDLLNSIPPEQITSEIVGEVCFEKYHGLELHYAGFGHENKFVLFFKKRNENNKVENK